MSRTYYMSNWQLNLRLRKSVLQGNLTLIESLIKQGADVRHSVALSRNGCVSGHILNSSVRTTLLHAAENVETTKLLLDNGALINGTDHLQETPLHSAVIYGKELDIIKLLLQRNAAVNEKNITEKTALDYAIICNAEQNIIKELLLYGAVPDVQTIMNNPAEGKLCIKMLLLYNFDGNYKSIINLDQYPRVSSYKNLKLYLKDCVNEILQMKSFIINKYSLYVITTTNSINVIVEITKNIKSQGVMAQIKEEYVIYIDIILEKIKHALARIYMLNKIWKVVFSTKIFRGSEYVDVDLNSDIMLQLYRYLMNDDIFNLLKACSGENISNMMEISDRQLESYFKIND